ncbi:NAD(P)-dependent dehydrogenase (short-subunit alcohol dehydrogenase family) [Sinobaca qinghaiensis]|uniref:NAD(P)-dependent dehydrogenase (Short-subunit alcohol dehydrogenase family) n=1 Tax=Sinobaca qinghaiensis TaxID=342944 RepID=A0A419V433_9BACL|nr:glucose 1-dehydrogenase [Sinobaca qinghaiensis]RKD73146.1 NAD(P)-dependent dehydrogenase (short-subunit alcohol dehydrogenase family) [Sinobaca qinghaiensis]
MARLQDKVAIVTGAAGGIGLGTAKLFAEEGAKVVVGDVQFDLLTEEAAKIKEEGGDITSLYLDTASEDSWKEAVQKTLETYGRIDILVNNAGIHIPNKILETSLDEWHQVMNINGTGYFLGMREVIPEMQKNGHGSIINIASISALTGTGAASGNGTAYSAAKGAVRSLTKHVAAHFAEEHIRANSIFPGPIKTPIMGERQKTIKEDNKNDVPLPPHHGEASDIAYAALYYASEESRFVTGDETVIDGGSVL